MLKESSPVPLLRTIVKGILESLMLDTHARTSYGGPLRPVVVVIIIIISFWGVTEQKGQRRDDKTEKAKKA